jgi:hypothetical protein
MHLEVRSDVKRWPAGSSKGGEFAPKAGGAGAAPKAQAVKVGARLQFSSGVDHATGKPVTNFRGTVARKAPDGRLMVNAGTNAKPRWVATHTDKVQTPARKLGPRNDNRRTYAQRLTEDERKAIDAYMGENYKSINGTLREGKPPSGVTAKRIAALDSAVSKGTLATDATLYRAAGGLGDDPSALIGKTFTDHGFASTSEGTQLPLMMASSRRNGIYARIKAPAGANVGYLTKVRNQQAISKYSGVAEREVLLPRGSQFKITNARQGGDGTWTVDMELIA